MTSLGPNMLNITCGVCGHTADFDLFTSTPVSGCLPRNTFQCPGCNYAWRLIPDGKGTRYPSGLYIGPDIKIEPIAPVL